MAGIYIHIPFCKKSCYYCDFYFSTSLKGKKELIDAIYLELARRKEELNGELIESIYFGGGTPSLLNEKELNQFFELIYQHFNVCARPEITLEANPDDLTPKKIKELKKAGVNRLSIGIQSFRDEDLLWMNRAHSSSQALECVQNCQHEGINNISIDLIYGFPSLSVEAWEQNLKTALSLNINHLSCYCLTVEPQTPLSYFIKKGKYTPLDEELSVEHFRLLLKLIEKEGWLQYEISNFCKKEHISKHNTSYWKSELYLGLGPSAHSYNGVTRRWNVANNIRYIEGVTSGLQFYNEEIISEDVSYNEYILTALRTIWGCSLEDIGKKYGDERKKYFINTAIQFIKKEWIEVDGLRYFLTNEGKLFADTIASELMIER